MHHRNKQNGYYHLNSLFTATEHTIIIIIILFVQNCDNKSNNNLYSRTEIPRPKHLQ